jgi:hypothetical protein
MARGITATAMVNLGLVLGELDRREEEEQAYGDVISRFGDDDEPGVWCEVAKATLRRALVLLEKGADDAAGDEFSRFVAQARRPISGDDVTDDDDRSLIAAWATDYLLKGLGRGFEAVEGFRSDLNELLALDTADELGLSSLAPLTFVGDYFAELGPIDPVDKERLAKALRAFARAPLDVRPTVEEMVRSVCKETSAPAPPDGKRIPEDQPAGTRCKR